MKVIDMDSWPRKDHFALFHSMELPQFNLSFHLDATHFLSYVREQGISFYYAMCFAATQTANEMESFRYRIRKDQVILHDRVHPSFTVLQPGEDLFKIVTMDMGDDLIAFAKEAAERVESQTDFLQTQAEQRDDLIYITCIPWVSFTQITHPTALSRDDSIPRISWGKYFQQDGKVLLPFSVQANHSLMDGSHAGRYAEKLQCYMDQL